LGWGSVRRGKRALDEVDQEDGGEKKLGDEERQIRPRLVWKKNLFVTTIVRKCRTGKGVLLERPPRRGMKAERKAPKGL